MAHYEAGTHYSNSEKPVIATHRTNEFGDTIFINHGIPDDRNECVVIVVKGKPTLCSTSVAAQIHDRLIRDSAHDLLAALEKVTTELAQLHRHHYPECGGGCPSDTYIAEAEAIIKTARG